ncbi:unnamed protein product [Owenia fusiformis]|uniref:Uncharacterized protein n=1 Tax=Owenia fusiformis TaxID=6347 RepID=A0A8J1Y1A9_OWEFU|nr:unnamed protein product [Owenia fusiformis]
MVNMAEVQVVVAKYDYTASGEEELNIKKNEKLTVLDDSKAWWKVQNTFGHTGFVPSNFVKKTKPSILSTLKNTLGRRRGSENKLNTSSHSSTARSNGQDSGRSSEQSSLSGFGNVVCDNIPATAKYAYDARQPDELKLAKGEKVFVTEKSSDGWWKGTKESGDSGWFPSNYVDELTESNMYEHPADSSDQTEDKLDDSSQPIETVRTLYQFSTTNPEELGFDKDEHLEILEKPEGDPDWWRARNKMGEIGLVPRNYVEVISGSFTQNSRGYTQITSQASGSSHSQTNSSASLSCHSFDSASASQSASNPSSSPLPVCTPTSTKDPYRYKYKLEASYKDRDWFYGNVKRADCDELLNQFAEMEDFLIRSSETNVGDYTVVLKASPRNKHFRVQTVDRQFCIGQQTFDTLDDLVLHYSTHPIFRNDVTKLYLKRPFRHPDDS